MKIYCAIRLRRYEKNLLKQQVDREIIIIDRPFEVNSKLRKVAFIIAKSFVGDILGIVKVIETDIPEVNCISLP